MALFKKNVFGQRIFVKRSIIFIFGSITYGRFNWRYKHEIKGAELLKDLPESNVMFISNHQTYFADVSFFFHVFHAALRGRPNSIKYPAYMRARKHKLYYVAAEETMKSGMIPKLLALSGAVTIKRTWREGGKNIRRKVDKKDTENIDRALQDGWVITFPQGTTKPYAPGRVGTAIIAKNNNAVVVPIVIDGFRRAFDKKGMKMKKKRVTLKTTIKPPLEINYEDVVEKILAQMMDAIEQSPRFDTMSKIKSEEE